MSVVVTFADFYRGIRYRIRVEVPLLWSAEQAARARLAKWVGYSETLPVWSVVAAPELEPTRTHGPPPPSPHVHRSTHPGEPIP